MYRRAVAEVRREARFLKRFGLGAVSGLLLVGVPAHAQQQKPNTELIVAVDLGYGDTGRDRGRISASNCGSGA
jgi:hypothetical protein